MTTALSLLVVDGLQGLTLCEPVASVLTEPQPDQTPSREEIYARLTSWDRDFVGGNAPATVTAVRADWAQYLTWCEATGSPALGCTVTQLDTFIGNAIDRGRKRSTVSRYVYTVGLIHDAAGLPNPVKDRTWKAKWKALARRLRKTGGSRVKQAAGLSSNRIDTILQTLGKSPRDLRDAAMLCVASDTLCRESELVRIRVEDIAQDSETQTWSVTLPFTKVDQEGTDEEERYVSQATVDRIRLWQASHQIDSGHLFLPLGGRPKNKSPVPRRGSVGQIIAISETPDPHLRPQEVARIFRKRAAAAGLKDWKGITGHSMRVGSASELIVDADRKLNHF
jgi:integrase